MTPATDLAVNPSYVMEQLSITTTMPLPESVQSQVSVLTKRLEKCEKQLKRLRDGPDDQLKKARDDDFISILRDACTLVHESEGNNHPHRLELCEAVQELANCAIDFAYGDGDLFDFMPSWAHDESRPLVEDHREVKVGLPHSAIAELLNILRVAGDKAWQIKPNPWNPTMKRHPKSSALVRFRPKLPTLTATSANPLAASVYDARCEITSGRTLSPIKIAVSADSSCLAMTGMGGWKNRSPGLECFFLDRADDDLRGFMASHFLVPGLTDITYHMALDDTRKLVFVGDRDRVKSYAWMNPDGTYYDELFPVHTLAADRSSGPIAILPNGTIVRAGKGGADVWSINGLETHGDTGDDIIGEELDDFDSMRDDPEDIEPSTGSSPTSRVTYLDQPNFKPSMWQPLLESPSTMLCVEAARETQKYGCMTLDLEAGGKISNRYIGHGGNVADISVSAADPRVFLTASHDGFARLYDVRHSLPVLTLDACGQEEFCEAAVLAHPDGIPTVFTGTAKQEQIKMWDIRARAAVYELATGNNAVSSLAWDSKRNRLYAATECFYMDRMGYRHEYRRAKIPKRSTGRNDEDQEMEGDIEDEDEEDDEDFDDDFEERCWPSRAWHGEDYFEHAFDAGDHRLYRYSFKESPADRVPEYGDASINESNQW